MIRLYRPSDLAALEQIHGALPSSAAGAPPFFCHPEHPVNSFTLVAEEDGRPVAAATARHTIEAFLLMDQTWGTPGDRWETVRALLTEGTSRARALGVREVHCPVMSYRFARRLLGLRGAHGDPRPRIIFNLATEHPADMVPGRPRLVVPLDAVQ